MKNLQQQQKIINLSLNEFFNFELWEQKFMYLFKVII